VGALALKNLAAAQPRRSARPSKAIPRRSWPCSGALVDAVVADIIIPGRPAGEFARTWRLHDRRRVARRRRLRDRRCARTTSKWRDALNFALQDMWKDGAWDKIYATWIGPGTKLNLEKAEIGFKMEVWE